MMRNRKVLTEKYHISDEVLDIANDIADRIIQETEGKQPAYHSRIRGIAYYEGDFEFGYNGKPMFNGITSITVNYLMYSVQSMNEYNLILNTDDGKNHNSFADVDKDEIFICSAFVMGDEAEDFYENVAHEVEHFMEYSFGRQKRVDLYDKVIENYKSGDALAKNVALTIYYTFRHEQTAFAHQFYANIETHDYESFDQALAYSQYQNLLNAINVVERFSVDEIARHLKTEYNMKYRSYRKRIHYHKKKFWQLLRNVYSRFLHDNRPVNDWRIRTEQRMLSEARSRYPKIKEGIERIYRYLWEN